MADRAHIGTYALVSADGTERRYVRPVSPRLWCCYVWVVARSERSQLETEGSDVDDVGWSLDSHVGACRGVAPRDADRAGGLNEPAPL
jgi:hypothetical protein